MIEAADPPRARRARWVWPGIFAAALVLYTNTANRGAQWQDSGWQQVRIVSGELDHPRGLALTHPLHYFLGRAAICLPIHEPAFAITLLSSFAAAVAVANLALAVEVLARSVAAAIIAAASLMLSHTFWQHATYTESYALTAALLTGEWACLAAFVRGEKPRYLLMVALLNGLGVANHLLALLALPVNLAIFAWAAAHRKLSKVSVGLAALLWLVGTLPYSGLVLATMLQTGNVWDTLRSAFFGVYAQQVLNVDFEAKLLPLSCGYLLYNFPGLTIPLAVFGAVDRCRRPYADRWLGRALLFELVIYTLFALRYPIGDQYTFYFPVYLLLALFAGLGLGRILAVRSWRLRRPVIALAVVTAFWPPIVYVGTCALMRARGALSSLVKNKPYRDGYRAFFIPWGLGADYAVQLNGAVRDLAGDDGLVLVSDPMQIFSLRYARMVGQLPKGVTVRMVWSSDSDAERAELEARAREYLSSDKVVVLVPLDRDNPGSPIAEARWERLGDIYRLVALGEPGTSRAAAEG